MRLFDRSIRSQSSWVGPAATLISLGLTAPPPSAGCPVYVPPTEQISIAITSGYAALLKIHAETSTERSSDMSTDLGPSCTAWIEIPLSKFPTSRLASRPADIARSMGDAMKKLGTRECEVRVIYDNDTGEEIADYELCLRESFEFGARKFWSKVSESYCWEPDSSEFDVMTVD